VITVFHCDMYLSECLANNISVRQLIYFSFVADGNSCRLNVLTVIMMTRLMKMQTMIINNNDNNNGDFNNCILLFRVTIFGLRLNAIRLCHIHTLSALLVFVVVDLIVRQVFFTSSHSTVIFMNTSLYIHLIQISLLLMGQEGKTVICTGNDARIVHLSLRHSLDLPCVISCL
jgi:hypothetical protein